MKENGSVDAGLKKKLPHDKGALTINITLLDAALAGNQPDC
jgi:hypothetical protein